MINQNIKLNNDWDTILSEEFREKNFHKIMSYIKNERQKNKIFPDEDDIFNALRLTSFQKTKVIIGEVRLPIGESYKESVLKHLGV